MHLEGKFRISVSIIRSSIMVPGAMLRGITWQRFQMENARHGMTTLEKIQAMPNALHPKNAQTITSASTPLKGICEKMLMGYGKLFIGRQNKSGGTLL